MHSQVLDNFLTTESPLKTKKKASYFTINAPFFPKIFKDLFAVEEPFPGSFLKAQNWVYVWINSPKFCTVCFYCMTSWVLSKYIETKPRPPGFTSFKAFSKNKRRSGINISALFSAWFLKKIFLRFSIIISISLPNFIVWLCLLREMLGSMYLVIIFEPSCDVINLVINLIFLIKPVFLHEQKVKTDL